MYDLNPPKVFVHKRVYENENATTHLERMLNALGNPPFEEVDESDADKVIEASGASEDLPVQSSRVRQGIEKIIDDPIMLFNTYVWDPDKVKPVKKKYTNPRARALAQFMAGAGEVPPTASAKQATAPIRVIPGFVRAAGAFTPSAAAFTNVTIVVWAML